MTRIYADRVEAGRLLGVAVRRRLGARDVVVLALPRGGVPVASEVAAALRAPLDVLVVRKVGAPFQPELALGAVGPGGVEVRNEDVLRMLTGGERAFESGAARERAEVARRERAYRGERPPLDLTGRTAVLVDDGVATGATALAAVRAARALGASGVVVAVPVASHEALELLRSETDDVVCLQAPPLFEAVGAWYADFAQVEDDEVRRLLSAPPWHDQPGPACA